MQQAVLETTINSRAVPDMPPEEGWDRTGLPAWTYTSEELLELEREHLFRRHWQLACHQNDLPKPGDYLSFDLCGERALIVRGADGVVRAFHNVCRHRGSRVVGEPRGNCPRAIVCPFHGWSYQSGRDRLKPRRFSPRVLPQTRSCGSRA